MTRIRHKDVAAFSRGLETLYSEVDMPSLPERVTRCLRELFEGDFASFDLINLSAVRWNTLVISPMLPDLDAIVAVLQQQGHEHPIVSHASRHQDPRAYRFSDFISLRQFRQTGLYQELFRPYAQGTDRQLGFVAKPMPNLSFGASVNRRGRDFTAEQRTLLDLLRPHLMQAHRLAQAHAEIQEHEQSVREDAAAAMDGGMCQIDPAGKLEWATKQTEGMLARYFPPGLARRSHLPSELLNALRPVLAGPRKSSNESPTPGRAWHFSGPGGTLKVRLAARSTAGKFHLLLTEEPTELSAEVLTARHGISEREGEVLFWVAHGKTDEEIGIILSISFRTVQKHLANLFEKLAVSNRTSAARIALGK